MKVVEIFKSLQGEGFHSGVPAVFIRSAECNIRCPFCDTQDAMKHFVVMTPAEIAEEVYDMIPVPLVIFTGGEPALHLDEIRDIINLLKAKTEVPPTFAIETNGTISVKVIREAGIDYVTVSPKSRWVTAGITLQNSSEWGLADEVKTLMDSTPQSKQYLEDIERIVDECETDTYPRLYVQPIATDLEETTALNTKAAVQFVIDNPRWTLSLQTHKILNIR